MEKKKSFFFFTPIVKCEPNSRTIKALNQKSKQQKKKKNAITSKIFNLSWYKEIISSDKFLYFLEKTESSYTFMH